MQAITKSFKKYFNQMLKKKNTAQETKVKEVIKWMLVSQNQFGNWEWMLTNGEKNIGHITKYSGCEKWHILIWDSSCKNKETFIEDEETAKAIALEAATSDSKLYRRALFKAVDTGLFETMTMSAAMVEMERIKRFVEIIKPVISEMFIETIDTGYGGIRIIHENY